MRNSFFFLIIFSSFSFGQTPLTTFFDGWEPRNFTVPDQTIPFNVISSSANAVISIDPSTEISDVLPSHFGTNMPSFLGGSKLNETDFMGHLKNLGPTYLRYPGGSGSDRFFWDGNLPSAILENDQIDVNNLISGTGFRISPFEFKDMLDSTSGEGIVVVNFGYARYGTAPNRVEVAAGYAADFVRHMNITLGANIKYWEIGNENYGRWEAGYSVQGDTLDGSEYGDIFTVFVDSMRSADPTIKLGAVVYPQDSSDACCDIGSWTKDVLQKVHNSADFLIVHDYFVRKPDENDVTYAEMLGSLSEVQEDMDNINNMLTEYTPKPAGYFPLAMTEYNSNSGEREISMANAIFIVQALCEQIKNEFGMSLIWDIQNGLSDDGGDHGMLAKSGAGNPSVVPENTPRPAYYIYYLLNNFFGDKLIASSSSDADISCYASKFSGNEVGMVLVNNSSVSKVIELDFGINGIGDDFYWYELYAPNETDKKVYINTISNNLVEGGPLNYDDLPSYHRLYDNNSKFELKPYSVNFLANSSFSNEIIGDTITIGSCDSYLWNGVSYSSSGFFSDTLVSVDGFDSIISLDLTIFSLPEVDAGADITICDGETVLLSGSGASSYAWDNGVINGASFNPSIGTTTYTLTGTGVNGCESTDEVEVIVNPLPEVNAGADQTICAGETVLLSGSGASSYAWDNGVINGASFNPSIGTTTYTLTGTNVNGCESTDEVEVIVNSLPEVDAGADITICAGETVFLSGSGASIYAWDNGVTDGVSFNPLIGTTTYALTGTDGNGCISADEVEVIVNSLPEVDAGADITICDGEMVLLSGSGASIYAWDNGVTDGVSFNPLIGTTTYTLTGTGVNGCESTDEVEVIVNSLPEVDAGADITICDGETVLLSGSGASSYAWDNGVINGVSFSPSLGTTTYALTGTDGNGCISADQVHVTMYSNPEVSFTLTQDSLCFSADSLELFGLPLGGSFSGNGVSNNWFYPSEAGLGGHILTYTFIDSTTSCFGSDSILIEVLGCAGVMNLGHEFIQVYPNPTFDKITIVIDGYNGPLEVEIYDLKGTLIKTFYNAEFSIKEFSKGTYILSVNCEGFSEKINIIKF